MTEMLKGIAASDGVAVAKAYLLVQPDLSFETVTVEDTSAEEARLDAALAASQDELSVIREKAVESLGEEAAAVFDAHLMVLADPEMTGQIKETIRAKQVNAEAALTEVTDMFIAILKVWKTTHTCKNVQRIFVTLQNVCLLTCLVKNCLTQQQSTKNQSLLLMT